MPTPTNWKLESPYHEAYKTWQQQGNTPESNKELLNTINPVIEKQLQRFNDEDRILLRPQAKLIALKSMSRYNPTTTNLNTWLSLQLQSLNRISRKQNTILRVPEKIQYDSQRLQDAAVELENHFGRPATIDELSDHVKLSPKRINYVMRHGTAANTGRFVAESEDSPITDPAVYLPVNQEIKIQMVYPDLTPRDKLVMEHSFGLYGKRRLSTADLAKKLKTSTATISQRRAYIQSLLEESESLLRD
jgi:DNA-directed RNA polymerase specialized sigma subunit